MTHAIRIYEQGGPEVLRWEAVTVGEPGPGEALVRHTAVGVNMIDTYHRAGVYSLPSLPHGIGVEAAGVVEAVGPGVDLAVGTRVAYGTTPAGAYAEARLFPADKLVPLPPTISDEVAAAGLVKGMTVEFLIRRTYRVQPGDWVLFHAAAGGVGSIAIQWLHRLGAQVIGTVGTEEKAELARSLGCAYPIVYTQEDFAARVLEITDGRGVDVVYDSVGKATFRRGLGTLRKRGMMVVFGNASGRPDPIEPLELARHGSLYLTRPTVFDYTSTRAELLESANTFFDAVAGGDVQVNIAHRWPLRDAAQAHRALESRATTGSSILIP